MKFRSSIGCLLLGGFLFSTGAKAIDFDLDYHPIGLVDLSTQTMAGMVTSVPMDDHMIGFVPEFSLQYGFGNFAVGIEWSFAVADVDGYDTGTHPGGIVLNLKTRKCNEGPWRTCYGLKVEAALSPFQVEDTSDSMAATVGLLTNLFRFGQFGSEMASIDPLLVLNTTDGSIFLQAVLGTSFVFPYADDHLGNSDTMETFLLYGAEVGLVMRNLVVAGMGVRGLYTLTFDNNENYLAIDFSARLLHDQASPFVRMTLPMASDMYTSSLDVIFAAGVTVPF